MKLMFRIFNIEILNDLNDSIYTLKMKLKPPVGGSKSLSLSLNHSFNRFVQTADSFRNEASDSLYEWVIRRVRL